MRSETGRAARAVYWLSRHWLGVAAAVLAAFVGLAFAAPLLMYAGAAGPAEFIYTLYKPLCHQFGFRSVFLFGDQAVYPLRQAEVGHLDTFQAYAIRDAGFRAHFAAAHTQLTGEPMAPDDVTTETIAPFTMPLQLAARAFTGSAEMGYKVALCERDIAIYAAMLAATLLFGLVRRRLRPAPLLLYLLLGIAPIGLNGGGQLLGGIPLFGSPPQPLWPAYETRPFMRFLTGALFGLMNVWLAYPYLEASMHEIRQDLEAKFSRKAAHAARRDAAQARLESYMEIWREEN